MKVQWVTSKPQSRPRGRDRRVHKRFDGLTGRTCGTPFREGCMAGVPSIPTLAGAVGRLTLALGAATSARGRAACRGRCVARALPRLHRAGSRPALAAWPSGMDDADLRRGMPDGLEHRYQLLDHLVAETSARLSPARRARSGTDASRRRLRPTTPEPRSSARCGTRVLDEAW